MRSYRPGFVVALSCAVGVALSSYGGALALPKFDVPSLPTDLQGTVIDCPDFLVPTVEVTPPPFVIGYPIVGFHVKIVGSLTKFHGRPNLPCGFPDYVAPLTDFEWSLDSRPEGSTAVLKNSGGLDPLLPLDRAGAYLVRLTVCPDGCTVDPPGAHLAPVHVDRLDFFVPVQALESAPLGPETMPAVVPSESVGLTPPPDTCSFGAGWLSKQWRAVRQIHGPDDYELIEGSVVRSRVSRKDDPLNHSSQDANFYVEPDPKYSYLRFEDPDGPPVLKPLEIEWERNSIPERYRPTPGDRASIFGYWVTDCGHNHPEIHPPVGMAVHRPRPIRIPDARTFPELGGQSAGTGVWVPGIITDMFFSTRGGLLLDCDTDTGLANTDPIISPNGTPAPACAPAASLRRLFEFNIYLPRDPRVTMQQAGFSVPPVPLYLQRDAVSGGPVPIIDTVQDPSGITYLRVTLDLRDFEGTTYAYRIAAGWVLPAADNWGLARFKLRLPRLEVFDDGDGSGRGDGDWRLWVNTNNASNVGFPPQEWIKIIERDVHGLEDFGGRPWETDAPTADRSLGPDLLRYPAPASQLIPGPRDYGILFHTTGYEADNLWDDDAGTVLWSHVTPGPLHTRPNQCASQVGLALGSGCVRYDAVFEAVPGPALAPPALSLAAQGLARQYVLRCGRFVPGGDDVGVCGGGVLDEILAAPVEVFAVEPLQEPLSPRSGAREFTDFLAFRVGGKETTMLTDITIEDFYRDITLTRSTDPALVSRVLADLRAVFDERTADPDLADEALLDAQILKLALPADLWTEHFASLQKVRSDPDATKAKFTGSGSLESSEGRVRLRSLVLHCSELRTPNSLSLTWGVDRFDLDLVMRSECATDEAGTGGETRTQRGLGFGRYNGAPGAAIEWTLVDNGGARADDSASITIRRAGDGSILLTASGAITRGNLEATGNE